MIKTDTPREAFMPEISISINEDAHRMLSDEYKKMSIEWLRLKAGTVPPPFEQWLATRLTLSVRKAAVPERELEEIQSFTAIEKLITGLQQNGYGLAHIGRQGATQAESAKAFAQALALGLGFSAQRVKRIEELLGYYSKGAKDVADAAHVGVTNRAYGGMHEAWRELAERTVKASDHLGEDRALGRVEGAIAILVAMHVITRESAVEKTEAFRLQLHERRK
jgi:hypothetical protein